MSEELCPQCNHPLSIHQHENWCDECGCGWWIDYGAENATLRKQLEGLTANSIYDRMYEAENQRDTLCKKLDRAVSRLNFYVRNREFSEVLYEFCKTTLAEIEKVDK